MSSTDDACKSSPRYLSSTPKLSIDFRAGQMASVRRASVLLVHMSARMSGFGTRVDFPANRPMPTGGKNEEGRPQGQPSSEYCCDDGIRRCAERERDYGGDDRSLSLLIIATPIKRAYIWDLAPFVSAVRYCIRAGLHAHLLEWMPASQQNNGLDEYAEAISGVAKISCQAAGTTPFLVPRR